MTRNTSIKLLAITAVAITVGVLAFIFRGKIFSDSKEQIYHLLHPNSRFAVKGDSMSISSRELLKKYFDVFGYRQTWSAKAKENEVYRKMLIQMLNQCDSLGLDRKEYHDDYVVKYDSLSRLESFDMGDFESENEVIFTDAAISFLYHVAYGKELKRVEFNGVNYNIDSAKILNMFSALLVHHDWRKTLDSLEPKTLQYLLLKKELNRMNAVWNNMSHDDSVTTADFKSGRPRTILKLKAYHLLSDALNEDSVSEEILKGGLIAFQKMMSLDTTGIPDKKTMAALAFPLSVRIDQIKESLNYWRWTGRLEEREFILVNIPAARLQLVNRDSVKNLSMRVIVGKTDSKTPSFTAYISKVITYPYWSVPFGIATKEMLPKIIKDQKYLDENNLQVTNAKGKELDPKSIPWAKLSQKYFPYFLRQSTGCDNALGLLKFELNSPFSIYLHDTNRKDLFSKKERFMSHGCVRLEKPMELAHYLLNESLDSTTEALLSTCMVDQKPGEIMLKKKFPVLLLYMTADVDENGNLKFYNDVYSMEKKNA